MRRWIDRAFAMFGYVPQRYLDRAHALLTKASERETKWADMYERQQREFYVDAAGHYWPVAPTVTHRGVPCS